MFELDVFLGLRKVPSPRGAVGGGVHQTVLDRYFLADTVFQMFGGRVDHPRPGCMSKGGFGLIGSSSGILFGVEGWPMLSRTHPQACLIASPYARVKH